jgi:3-methyladenine DNA glycosylase AlkD
MKVNEIYEDFTNFCRNNSDPNIVKKYSRFFTEGYDAYGVDSKLLESTLKEKIEFYKDKLSIKDVLELCTLFYKSGKYEEGGIAMWFMRAFSKNFKKNHINSIKEWLDKYITNWAHTDILSGEVISTFLTNDIIKLSDIENWKISKSKWTRRAVPVSLIKTIKKEKVSVLLKFIDPLIEDDEKVVQQGLGWFLREAWKKEPKEVEKYLLKIKDYSPRLIIQYATEKMNKAQKAKYKKTKG